MENTIYPDGTILVLPIENDMTPGTWALSPTPSGFLNKGIDQNTGNVK